MNYEIHSVANIFPAMGEQEFRALKTDISIYGQRDPIWLFENKVIDGRHRLRACNELGIKPTAREYAGADPVAFVVSLNLHRRHLTESQRGMVAANLANMAQGERTDIEHPANLPKVSQAQAAELLNVSERTVRAAVRVKDEGTPELVAAVESGIASVSAASVIASEPREAQREIVARVESNETTFAKAAQEIHNHRAQGTGENEWYTPQEYVEAAREVLGDFDLDPASSDIAQQRIKAAEYFTLADDGLSKDWYGRVWLNPPYAQPAIRQFIEKLCAEYSDSDVVGAVLLTHNYTDTAWFHIAAQQASAICFTRGRIGFLSPEGKRAAPTQGQAFFYFGPDSERFADVFQRFGLVVSVARSQSAPIANELEDAA